MRSTHIENHQVHRIGWLRAAVLGANDGLISTASLIVGVAVASTSASQIILAGAAGMVAGAMSMATGEYVSVSSQLDTENADVARERRELKVDPDSELVELANLYKKRGLTDELALVVARQLTKYDALGSHVRDELGITDTANAKPLQAALTSALTFAVGAALPLLVAIFSPAPIAFLTVSFSTLIFLGVLGAVGAKAGGASVVKPTFRIMFWGALALLITAGIGKLFGVVAG